jgi:hypothetical protein
MTLHKYTTSLGGTVLKKTNGRKEEKKIKKAEKTPEKLNVKCLKKVHVKSTSIGFLTPLSKKPGIRKNWIKKYKFKATLLNFLNINGVNKKRGEKEIRGGG